ncbi:MAG: glycerol-3-phosphate 1-O-acyltransferase PlsY [Candidatus Zixiibacteriota bacterium]|nr:MAG: glycerol-3-phosphate 1-O-acyltransferase PlsY [candidate division Zixibacteria bacterium]
MAVVGIIVILSYTLGSVPFAVIIGRIWRGIDIRDHGSRNAGFTNVYRVIGPLPAAIVLVLDVGKGMAAVLLSIQIVPDTFPLSGVDLKILAAICVILGHVFPLFAGFRGGKGAATGLGALLSITPLEAALALVLFVLIVAITRYVSLGSLSAAVFIFLALLFERYYLKAEVHGHLILTMLFLNGFVFFNHRGNIRRLLTGTENKFGRRRSEAN